MTTPLTGVNSHTTSYTMVTQLYTFGSWTKSKSFSHSSNGMPYVGFPGLTLTPIPENPLLDSLLQDEGLEPCERERWLKELEDAAPGDTTTWNLHSMEKGALPTHWVTTPSDPLVCHDVGATRDSSRPSRSKTCSEDVSSKTSFLSSRDGNLSKAERQRSYLVKLLLFALCGIVVVAGIVLWIFSPAFA